MLGFNDGSVAAKSFHGDGSGLTNLTGITPTNINSGYASGLSIGGNALTAITATTANAGDSATGFFSSGTIEPARLATNAAANALILKATSTTTAKWDTEAAGPTNIVNDGQYVWLTGTNAVATSGSSLRLGQTDVLMRLNGGALILADESTGVVEYYGVDSADGISITNNANGGGIGINPASPSDTVYIHGDLSVSGSS